MRKVYGHKLAHAILVSAELTSSRRMIFYANVVFLTKIKREFSKDEQFVLVIWPVREFDS